MAPNGGSSGTRARRPGRLRGAARVRRLAPGGHAGPRRPHAARLGGQRAAHAARRHGADGAVFWLPAADSFAADDQAAALDDMTYYTDRIAPVLERYGIEL